jgi:hypothetical protein
LLESLLKLLFSYIDHLVIMYWEKKCS